MYGYGSFCDLETRAEYGAFCPLTCPVVKHGVLSAGLTKTTKAKAERPARFTWGNASDVQSKRTSELRVENPYYSRIYSGVLQGNLAKLDAAFTGFFKHERGFPAFRTKATFNSFQYKPGQARLDINRTAKRNKRTGDRQHCYSHVDLPGIGRMRFLDSREIPEAAKIGTLTVKHEADGWYLSVLLELAEALPAIRTDVRSSVGIDVGINKLVALSDGSFVENPKFASNPKTRRQLRIRQRRVNRKVKGSKNRAKAGIRVAQLHKKIRDRREAYQWQAANQIVKTADAVVHEDLNIKGMKARCKPKRSQGRFMPNGQSAKRGLNRAISDAAWSGLFAKVGWLGSKAGKPVLADNPAFTSQECSACGHCSKDNRDGEKFLCAECGHVDHADTQASRTINHRAGFRFVSKDIKNLPGDSRKVTPRQNPDISLPQGERGEGRNRISKAMPEKRILSDSG
jgi:putative transposase